VQRKMHQYGLDLECLLEFFNTHGAEVTPGSNVVGEDLQGDRLGHALPSSPAIRSGHCRAAGGSGNANPDAGTCESAISQLRPDETAFRYFPHHSATIERVWRGIVA
jgi:hypothetical protein